MIESGNKLNIETVYEYTKRILADFWYTFGEMSPYLLFGFFTAGLLSMFISQKVVERHLGGRGMWPLLKASLFGVPLPLCSCGVIPVSMSLHKHGASRGATIAFLLSTPQTGMDSIFVTLSLLGPVFAILRPVAAFLTGLVGGAATDILTHNEKDTAAAGGENTANIVKRKGFGRVIDGFRYGFVRLPKDIGKAMLLGLLIAALISAFVPEGFFSEKLGGGIGAMLVMMALGIPVYVCATASVPVAAAMMLKGLTPGAAIVFLMTGPATNMASFITIWKVLGRKTAIIYIVTVALCSLAAGLTVDHLFKVSGAGIKTGGMEMLPGYIKNISAILLLVVLSGAFIRRKGPCAA